MNKHLWTILTITALGIAGCGSDGSGQQLMASGPTGTSGTATSGTGASSTDASLPTDFTTFVITAMTMHATPFAEPTVMSSVNTGWALDDATAFNQVIFGDGDALPEGTNQAAVACAQSGTAACNPSVSTDLNSNLN